VTRDEKEEKEEGETDQDSPTKNSATYDVKMTNDEPSE